MGPVYPLVVLKPLAKYRFCHKTFSEFKRLIGRRSFFRHLISSHGGFDRISARHSTPNRKIDNATICRGRFAHKIIHNKHCFLCSFGMRSILITNLLPHPLGTSPSLSVKPFSNQHNSASEARAVFHEAFDK